MITEVALVTFLALLNGFFALSEMALMTSRKLRLRQLAKTSRRAQIALDLAQKPEHFLSTVQVFITLLGIGTGTALGARIGDEIAVMLNALHHPLIAQYAIPLGIGLSISGITFINMLLGELLPKRLALISPEKFAIATAIPMRVMTWIAMPFAFVLIAITRALLRLFKLDQTSGERVSEEEIRLLVSEGAEQGVIDSDERNMVNRVLRLGDRSVDSLMTPRTRIAWLDLSASLAENLSVMREASHSRYPVYRGSDKDVVGVLQVKSLIDILDRQPAVPGSTGRGSAQDARSVDLFRTMAKPVYVPGTARALDLLEELREAETPLALVVDEYGDIDGLVTLNDLLGAVVGKAATPAIQTSGSPIVRREDGSWLIDGALGVDDVRELTGVVHLPHEADDDYRTAAGMVIAQFGRIPQVAEHFNWQGFRFEVIDLDGARIDKLLITRVAPDTALVDDSG